MCRQIPSRKCKDLYTKGTKGHPQGTSRGPITQDADTRGEQDVAKKAATQGDKAGITTSHGTHESQLETQETQDTEKGDGVSTAETPKTDP